MRASLPSLFVLLLHSLAGAGPPSQEVAIYPGFSKEELPTSLRAVASAATTCHTHGEAVEAPDTRRATAPHLSATVVDGNEVELLERSVEVACGTLPLRKCTYTYVWAKGSDQIGLGSIQCLGSHEDGYTSYLATAAIDLRKANKPDVIGTRKDKAVVLTSLTFQTDAFPGSHITAFVARRRADGSTEEPPKVMQFDDFAATDNATGALTGAEMNQLAQLIVGVSCEATGACDEAEPTETTAQLR